VVVFVVVVVFDGNDDAAAHFSENARAGNGSGAKNTPEGKPNACHNLTPLRAVSENSFAS
jgi:hypothetical protein